jgi:hypothetical protein
MRLQLKIMHFKKEEKFALFQKAVEYQTDLMIQVFLFLICLIYHLYEI